MELRIVDLTAGAGFLITYKMSATEESIYGKSSQRKR